MRSHLADADEARGPGLEHELALFETRLARELDDSTGLLERDLQHLLVKRVVIGRGPGGRIGSVGRAVLEHQLFDAQRELGRVIEVGGLARG